jgi:hypothetical protein
MRINGFWMAGVLLFCLTGTGCGGKSSTPSPASTEDAASKEPKSPNIERIDGKKGRIVPLVEADVPESTADPIPSGITGKWMLNLAVMWPDVTQLCMVEIASDGDALEAKVVDSAIRQKVEIRDFKLVDDRVSFELAIADQKWPFDGSVVGGRVQGCVELQDRVSLTWLERTKLRSMPVSQSGGSPAGMADFAAAQRAEDPKDVLQAMTLFVERHATSPLAFDALRTVVRVAKVAEISEEDLRAAIAKYVELSAAWGQRWSENSIENVAYDLATADGPASPAIDAVALEFAERAKDAMPEGAGRARRQLIQLAYAVALVNNDRAEEGKKLMDELIAAAPDEGELLFRSALAAEKLGDFDGAVDSLMKLWPHPVAARELERIWKGKHGDLSGLEDRLDEAYQQRFPPIPTTPFAGREDPASNQVALVELFTGTGCPPCVAADVAFETLGRTFKTSDVVLLQYHLHVPSPDPLTNADAEERATYYQARGTPFILINGKESVRGGGPRGRAPNLLEEYRRGVEAQLAQKTPAKIDLSAKLDGGQIAIEVKLSDVEPSEQLRLRLAVVEETVRFSGTNGVRLHHSVVRAMPGGAAGIAVSEAAMTHNVTVTIDELRESLSTYLTDFEKTFSQENNGTFEFPSKPLGLTHLGVAAFLQNDETQEVVQAAFVRLEK